MDNMNGLELVRVLQIGRGLYFLDEPFGSEHGRKFRLQDFDRYLAFVFRSSAR